MYKMDTMCSCERPETDSAIPNGKLLWYCPDCGKEFFAPETHPEDSPHFADAVNVKIRVVGNRMIFEELD